MIEEAAKREPTPGRREAVANARAYVRHLRARRVVILGYAAAYKDPAPFDEGPLWADCVDIPAALFSRLCASEDLEGVHVALSEDPVGSGAPATEAAVN